MSARHPAEIHGLFQHAFNAGEVESLTALYQPNAVLVVGGKNVIGHENIRQAFESLVAQGARMTLETRMIVESPDGLAVLHGSWIVEPPPGTGNAAPTHGMSTEVIRKQADGTWLFIIDNPYSYG